LIGANSETLDLTMLKLDEASGYGEHSNQAQRSHRAPSRTRSRDPLRHPG